MVRKTMKDLDEEIVQLNNVMNDVKRMLDEVYKKYDDLEERVLSFVTDDDHVCSVCDKKLKNQKESQEHIKEHRRNDGPFSCEVCKRVFDEEWKLRAHKKSHSGIKCDLCEEKFRCKDLMEKHVKVVHENVKFYFHFYNNDKEQGCARPLFHFGTDTETFGCGYQKPRLGLRLLVVGIKSRD